MLGPLIAVFCVNDVNYHLEHLIQEVHRAEQLVESGQYEKARTLVDGMPASVSGSHLGGRVTDVRAILVLRARKKTDETSWVVPHFKERLKWSKSPQHQALLAEAELAAGNGIEALRLVNELRTKDLMPDAQAYVVLAKLSIDKPRDAALATCRTRTKVKSICKV